MILIADSGSTKTHWILSNGTQREVYFSAGLNPQFLSVSEMMAEIRTVHSIVSAADKIKEVHFFGAGCSTRLLSSLVEEALHGVFNFARITVKSDLIGSVIATCRDQPGISCILGTGSNACFFDGHKIHQKSLSMGFILGDEGSGAYFGKVMVRDFVYGKLPLELNDYLLHLKLNRDVILEKVYRQPGANSYLASFTKILYEFKSVPYVQDLLKTGFKEFIDNQVTVYPESETVPVHFVGSVAHFFKDELLEVLLEANLNPGRVIRQPADGILNYFENT